MPANLPGDGVASMNPNAPTPNAQHEAPRPTPWGYDPAKLLRYILDVLAEGGPQAAERARQWAQARLDELVASGAPIVTEAPTSTTPLPGVTAPPVRSATPARSSSTSCCAASSSTSASSSSTTASRPPTGGTP